MAQRSDQEELEFQFNRIQEDWRGPIRKLAEEMAVRRYLALQPSREVQALANAARFGIRIVHRERGLLRGEIDEQEIFLPVEAVLESLGHIKKMLRSIPCLGPTSGGGIPVNGRGQLRYIPAKRQKTGG